jgi:hypothetical protein
LNLKYPKWKYRVDPIDKVFQSTLVANAEAEAEIGPSWTDNPHEHGIEVVPHPAELTPGGTLMHHPIQADANGNHPFGPAPTASGIGGAVVGRQK